MLNYDKIKELVDVSYWGNTPIEQVPIWEIRDLLSHSNYLELSNEELQLVNNIVANQPYFSWRKENLSIFGEAKVQQLLRLDGYELFCADLNSFPTDSKNLRQYISKHSLTKQITSNIKYLKYFLVKQLSDLFFKIYETLGIHYNLTVKGQVIAVGLFLYAMYSDLSLLGYALIAAYISSNCMAMVVHEYWVHNQLKPKNRIVGFIFDYLGLLFFGDRLNWKYRHNYHHIHWKTRKDVELIGMRSVPWWRYLFMGSKLTNTPYGDITKESDKFGSDAGEYAKNNINKLLPESKFLENHVVSITLISNLALLLLLGPTVYIYFVFFQVWVFQRYIPGFNELVTHYNDKTREEEADTPYLFPICCGTAYHNTHHTQPTTVVLGPKWVKYFNVQYYFVKLFYNLNPGIKLS